MFTVLVNFAPAHSYTLMKSKSLFDEAVEELGYKASGSLRSTSEADGQPNFEDLTSISEWLALGKAKRLQAHYVYFRRFDDRPSQPIIYIYNFAEGMPDGAKLGEVQRDIWSSGEVPCAFIFTKDSVRIINTTCQPIQNGDKLEPVDLIGLAHEINDDIRKRFISYQLDSGEFWHEEAKELAYDRSAHKTLLKKLGVVKNKLIDEKIDGKLVNRLLIQCVLLRFLEEKKERDENGVERCVFPDYFFQEIAQANNFRESLKNGNFIKIFRYLNTKDSLNGQIFYLSEQEEEQLSRIPSSDLVDWLYETTKDETSQLAFWDLYSFRFLPVEVISSIYEALFTTDRSVKEDGMVYTPPHLAAFLVDEAMPLNAWRSKEDFKVLDPACGSGIFLVLAFKRLVHWWRLQNGGKAPHATDLTDILSKSITGIDKAENAVLLTRFSLCLAVTDMLTPPEVYKDLHFPELKEKLVESDFFKWYEVNNGSARFDLVIGNPPFVQAHKELPNWKELSEVAIPQKQIALYFLSAGMKLVKEKGLLCLLLKSSSLLYTSTGNNYRKHFFEKNNVRQIIDFTLMARNHVLWEVGEPDTTAIFVSKEKPTLQTNILHLVVKRTPINGLKRYFEIDAYDFHWVPYIVALQDDFVWKCNLLGGGRLYNLTKSIKTYPTIFDYLRSKKWHFGEGYETISTQAEKDADYITGKPYLPYECLTTDGIICNELPIEHSTKFYRPAKKELYAPPHILLREVVNDNGLFSIGFSDKYLTFKVQIIGISAPYQEREELYSLFTHIHNASKFYYAIIFATSPRCLVVKNTSFIPSDFYNLPYDISNNLSLTPHQQIVINDVVDYYQLYIRHTKNVVLNSILSKNLSKKFSEFSIIFCEVLNSIFQKGNNRFHLSDAGTLHNNSFLYVAFRYDDKPDFTFSEVSEEPPIASEGKLQELLTLDKGYAKFSRILKIYKKDYVCFIKPNQLRYWLDSIALRDADWVLEDLVRNGH